MNKPRSRKPRRVPRRAALGCAGVAALTALTALVATRARAESPLVAPYAPSAGRVTIDAVLANPANAALLPGTTSAVGLFALDQSHLTMHYREADPIEKSHSWTPNPLSIHGGTVYKFGNFALGLTGLIPPLDANVRVEGLPIVVLGQPNEVDVDAHVVSKGGGTVVASYAFSRRLSIGMQAHYSALDLTADTFSSATGAPLVGMHAQASYVDTAVGVRWQPWHALCLALMTSVAGQTKQKAQLESPLLASQAASSLGASDLSVDLTKTDPPLARGSLGVGARITSHLRLVGDLLWRRADPNDRQLSPVELREKPRDTYTSVGVAGGADLDPVREFGVYVRGQYQPPSVGRGGRGLDSKTGYGTTDILQVFLGVNDLAPYTAVEGGARVSRDGSNDSFFAQIELTAGVRYVVASLGINASGELPAAYTESRWLVPVTLSVRM